MRDEAWAWDEHQCISKTKLNDQPRDPFELLAARAKLLQELMDQQADRVTSRGFRARAWWAWWAWWAWA